MVLLTLYLSGTTVSGYQIKHLLDLSEKLETRLNSLRRCLMPGILKNYNTFETDHPRVFGETVLPRAGKNK